MPKGAKIGELTNSRSQILDYKNCGYRWDLGYRRGIASANLSEKMDTGSAVHMGIKHAVQAYAASNSKAKIARDFPRVQSGVNQWAKETKERLGVYFNDQHEAEIEVIRNDAVGIAVKALDNIRLQDWEVATFDGKPLCEVELMVPLHPWKGFRTIPDLVARPRSEGKKAPWWLIDWKSRTSFESDDAEEINMQFATMQLIVESVCNLSIDGSILWQIKSSSPKKPELNKNGSMSRAQIASDWETYSAALHSAGLDPADYADMKEKLGLVEWFRTIKQHRSLEECEAVWEQVVAPTSMRMARDPDITRRMVHQPFACSGCWARNFCLTELRGEDTEFLLQTDYMDTRNPRPVLETGSTRRTFNLVEK